MGERINTRTKTGLRIVAAVVKGAFFILLYGIFWNSSQKGEICLGQYRFLMLTVVYWAFAAAIFFWNIWMPALWNRMGLRAQKGVSLLLWAAAPVLAYLTTELACNKSWKTIALKYAGYNCLIYLICGIVLALILGNIRTALTLVETIALIYGIASHYVLEFKDTTLRPSELMGAQTGLAVAGEFSYALSNGVVKAILLSMLAFITIRFAAGKRLRVKTNQEGKGKRLAIRLAMAAGGAALFYISFGITDIEELTGVSVNVWRPRTVYSEAGSALCFLIDAQSLRVEKPEGYTDEKAEEILASYDTEETQITEAQTELPNVIVIMNESFSDPSVVGPFESEEYLTNLNSLTDYLMKGYVSVSVYGGGTCNSEFEFLTGSSIELFGTNIYAYQTLDFNGEASMTGVFEDLGYQTVALHPSAAENWNRSRVYSRMGFDSFVSQENGFADGVEWKGGWIDDASDYKEVIRQLEAAEDPAFLFNVTVQNHAGYYTSKLEGKDLVTVEEQYQGYDSVIAYLTGVKYSDEALGDLIAYLRDYDEPVILCFFGDHQAKISTDFLDEIEADNEDNAGKSELEILQNRYKVPYLIWSNYLEPEQQEMDLSLNYLGAWLLNYAGIQTSYSEYLLDLQDTIQAVNLNGYLKDDVWYGAEETDESLDDYNIVQYYRLFESNS